MFDAQVRSAVTAVVQRQRQSGITMLSDGEQSKISYATYTAGRLHGFELRQRSVFAAAHPDLADFPGFALMSGRAVASIATRPVCVGPIAYGSKHELNRDIANLGDALRTDEQGFLTAPSPGTIAMFQDNAYYASTEEFLYAVGEAMRTEYEAIVEAGLVLQVDAPDVPCGETVRIPAEGKRAPIEMRIEVLNHALRNIPGERVRMHLCWGNYAGPHHHDAPIETLLPNVFRARPSMIAFEAANPRHEHEWEAWAEVAIPDDKILIPGAIDSTSNYIEHPRLVAQRLRHYTAIVGNDRVMAGSDCGFGTWAGVQAVDTDICYAKLASLSEGAQLV
jgi:5-methyltetrahydropteroyltriglutamate--homocysteine methyltransferase